MQDVLFKIKNLIPFTAKPKVFIFEITNHIEADFFKSFSVNFCIDAFIIKKGTCII